MASLKDKLKSKIKSRPQAETMQCFDQSSLTVNLIEGKSQLSQMKVVCAWSNKNNIKVPRLRCKWYNRTEDNYQQIVGIEQESYQPSVLDVDSIIEVTCIPQLPGVNYEGMPILLKSSKVGLSPETEAEAKRMRECAVVKLIIKLKSVRLRNIAVAPGSQAMIHVEGGQLTILETKFGQINDQVLKVMEIDQHYPQITLNRKNPKEAVFKFNEEESCVAMFKGNDIRDSFYLFYKIFVAQKSLARLEEKVSEKIDQEEKQIKQESAQEEKSEISQKSVQSEEKIQLRERKSEQKIQPKAQIDSSKNIAKGETPLKQSATDLLQLVKLKDQIKRLQQEGGKVLKQLQQQKSKAYTLQNKILHLNERLESASNNYFLLQQQLKQSKQQTASLQQKLQGFQQIENSKLQQIIYYKNQIKLVTDESSKLKQHYASMQQSYEGMQQQMQFYRQRYSNKDSSFSYKQLFEELTNLKQISKQLKLKYQFQLEQKEKMQQTLKNSRGLIEQIESQKRHIQKKYESLTNQLNSSTLSPTLSSRISQRSPEKTNLSTSFIVDEAPHLDRRQSFNKPITCQSEFREKQILQLKRQIKELIEENNYLRKLCVKQKKGTSKTQLKLELYDARKIVARLSEAIGEKEMAINQLRQVNKEMNRKNQLLEQQLREIKQ